MDFPDRLWEWYGQDEYKRIRNIILGRKPN